MQTENTESRIKIKSFTDLRVWQEAHKLVVMIYRETKNFPKEEIFGLTSQLRRCAVSISSNIAEGFSRQSYKEKIQFYFMALGSITELQNQILVARDVGCVAKAEFSKIAEQSILVKRILSGLIKKSKNINES